MEKVGEEQCALCGAEGRVVPNVDADVLEDHTESSLWCWEVMLFA